MVAACGDPQGEPPETSTTTTASPSTTTTSEPTTTTTVPATTTTTTPDQGDHGSLMASIDADSAVTSARVEGSIEMTGLDDSDTGVSEAVILFSSEFNATTGDSSTMMDMSSLMGSMDTDGDDPFADMASGMFSEMEMRQVGDTAYVRFPFITALLGADTEWVSMPADESDAFTSDFETFPTDPNELVENFDEEGASIEVVGTETVNGVEATHYVVSLDPGAMDLSAEEQADLADSGVLTNAVIPLDIWVSEEGYMVRMIMEIDGSEMQVPSGEEFDTMTMRYDFFDVNGEIVIEEPPASQVTALDDLEGAFDLEP